MSYLKQKHPCESPKQGPQTDAELITAIGLLLFLRAYEGGGPGGEIICAPRIDATQMPRTSPKKD